MWKYRSWMNCDVQCHQRSAVASVPYLISQMSVKFDNGEQQKEGAMSRQKRNPTIRTLMLRSDLNDSGDGRLIILRESGDSTRAYVPDLTGQEAGVTEVVSWAGCVNSLRFCVMISECSSSK